MTYLSEILARKGAEVEARRAELPERELEARTRDLPPCRDLAAALSPPGGPVRVVAEVKRASPSAGAIDATLDAPAQAARYAAAGAAAISVLTDGPGFGGSLSDLAAVRAVVDRPVLRKDFVLARYQLLEARVHGADAALLIVAALPGDELRRRLDECRALGLSALVEVHDEPEAERALSAGATVIGVNHRDLRTFRVDLAASERVLPRLPRAVRAVAESGIRGPAEVARLRACGAANFLVGEALVRAADPGALLRALVAAGDPPARDGVESPPSGPGGRG
jgi:indole-3-glycerol phosphate synthase